MISQYLPSARFTSVAISVLLAGAIILGAQYVSKPKVPSSLATTPTTPVEQDWQQTLEDIQLQAGITAPEPPAESVVSELLQAAQSSNLTTSIGRTLLVNLSAANAQGLGSDIPTQDALIEAAISQVGGDAARPYTAGAVITTPQTKESLYIYGNQLMTTMQRHPEANAEVILFAFGEALDYRDAGKLVSVRAAESAYKNLAAELMLMPVPETLTPLHAEVVNNLARMGTATTDMQAVLDDPLRGLAGLQLFNTSSSEAARLLTSIAKTFDNNGILFTEDDPGTAWRSFVVSP